MAFTYYENCILPSQIYAIMKGTYAGGQPSNIRIAITRPINSASTADVVLACVYSGDCNRKFGSSFNMGLGRVFSCYSVSTQIRGGTEYAFTT